MFQKLFSVIGPRVREGRSLTGENKILLIFSFLTIKHISEVSKKLKFNNVFFFFYIYLDEDVVMGNKLLVYIR